MRVILKILLILLAIVSVQQIQAQNLFLDQKIKETIDDSISDLNTELKKANSLKDELDYPLEISSEKIELQVDQSILDSVCVDCPKLANLATQVNSALKNLVSTTSLKESNLPLELQNLEAMTYVVRDAAHKSQALQCPISSDLSFSQIISNKQLESHLAVLILSKEVDKGTISSVQIYKPGQQKVFYYRGKIPHQDKIVRVTVGSHQKAKVDYFVLTPSSTDAKAVEKKLSLAREARKTECGHKNTQGSGGLVKGVEVSSEDCKAKVSLQAGLGMSSSKDSSGADQIGEIKLVDVQAKIIEGPIGANIGAVVTNRGTTARLGIGDQNKELIYTKLTDIEGGEISGGVPYEIKTPGKIGAQFSGEFSGRKNLKTGSQSEQVSIKVQPTFIGTSLSASAQANHQVVGKKINYSENYSLELNQPVGPGNLCFRYSFQMINMNLMDPSYWACYRVRF
jgi:hypothetical protein